MTISYPTSINILRDLFGKPQNYIETNFSPYFYRYFNRYKNPYKFDGYLQLCRHIFNVTHSAVASVLDLGCGFGFMAIVFGFYGSKEVIGYDLNTEKIELFKKLLSYLGEEVKHVKPVLGDSSKIEYPDEYFDVVIANETISHFREMGKSFGEVYRVLKSGGTFLIRDGNNRLFLPGNIRRKKFWKIIERGPVDPSWFRSTDIPLPFFEIRKKMILEKFPQMDLGKAIFLSKETAGMFGDEIFNAINEFEIIGKISNKPEFKYRNPVTGEFPEREINPFSLKRLLKKSGFEVSFIPYFYSESFRDMELFIKRIYYWIERFLPKIHLFLSPGFTILGIKRKQN
jgi:ubiquinone/menaquinone biosynthesis C-methylase UbiE